MRVLISLIVIFIPAVVFSQSIEAYTEASAYSSFGENMPYWLISNREGRYMNAGSGLSLRAGANKAIEQDKFWDYGFGLEYDGMQGEQFQHWPHEYYARLKLWIGSLTVGARSETFGNHDSNLSSGGLLWSENARPVPKIALSTNGYTDVPLTKGYLEFQAYLAHGWLEEQRYTARPYLHQKHYWLRAGGDFPVNAEFGFFHYALWGGNSSKFGELSSDFEAFKQVFLVREGTEDTKIPGEKINKLGNHLGSRNFGLSVDLQKAKIKLYWQTIFEDGSGYAWRNIGDGLYGLRIAFKEGKTVKKVLYEHLRTNDQSGPVHDINDTLVLGGNDNYFNNYVYLSGWTHHGMTIGNPLLTSPRLSGSAYRIQNNVIVAHHLGITGDLFERFPYKALFTYSRNFGLNLFPDAPYQKQVSAFFEVSWPIKNLRHSQLKGQLAIDMGGHYNRGIGLMLQFRKAFAIQSESRGK